MFAQKCERLGSPEILELPEVCPEHFEMLVRFLYAGTYQNSRTGLSEDEFSANFKAHAEMYCLATKYDLHELASLAIIQMATGDKLDFKGLVEIAKVIYPKLPDDDIRFSAYFKAKASRAIWENPLVAEEPWILDIYENEGGRLAVDFFRTFVAKQTEKGSLNNGTVNKSKTSPASSKLDQGSNTAGCKNRATHLKSLKKNSQDGCQKCIKERDRIIMTRSAVVSVAVHHLLPSIYPNTRLSSRPCNAKSLSTAMEHDLRIAIRDHIIDESITPISSLILEISNNESVGYCPDQTKHLKRKEDEWGWKNCPWCLDDRDRLLGQIQKCDRGEFLYGFAERQKSCQQKRQNFANISEEPNFPECIAEPIKVDVPVELSFPTVDIPKVNFPASTQQVFTDIEQFSQLERSASLSYGSSLDLESDIMPCPSVDIPSSPTYPPEAFSTNDIIADVSADFPSDVSVSATPIKGSLPSSLTEAISFDPPTDEVQEFNSSTSAQKNIDRWGSWGFAPKMKGKTNKGKEVEVYGVDESTFPTWASIRKKNLKRVEDVGKNSAGTLVEDSPNPPIETTLPGAKNASINQEARQVISDGWGFFLGGRDVETIVSEESSFLSPDLISIPPIETASQPDPAPPMEEAVLREIGLVINKKDKGKKVKSRKDELRSKKKGKSKKVVQPIADNTPLPYDDVVQLEPLSIIGNATVSENPSDIASIEKLEKEKLREAKLAAKDKTSKEKLGKDKMEGKSKVQKAEGIPPSFAPIDYLETCASRSIHLRAESLWKDCPLCSRELASVALDLANREDLIYVM